MEPIHHLKRCTPSLHCKCYPTQWGFSKEPLAAGGNVENSPVLGYNYNLNESDYGNDDNHGSYAGNGPNEPINGGSLSMNTSISTTQSLQLTTSYYFYSFDNKLMAEYDETGACLREYIYMGDRLIAEYLPQTNQYYYYTTDHINSTHMVTDDNGEKVYYTLFGPYGERIIPLEQVTTYDPQLKFSGKEREPEAEIDYFGARYYDHKSYRFNSVDPIINREEALYNPQLWNLYSYCRNNPITFMDTDGRRETIGDSYNNARDRILRQYGPEAAAEFEAGYKTGMVISIAVAAAVLIPFIENEYCHSKQRQSEPISKDAKRTAKKLFKNPDKKPGKNWEKRGGERGNWYNVETGESLHTDLDHPDPVGPHIDYKDKSGVWWRIDSKGNVFKKGRR